MCMTPLDATRSVSVVGKPLTSSLSLMSQSKCSFWPSLLVRLVGAMIADEQMLCSVIW